MPDLSGKIIIVTGGYCGIGYEAVKACCGKGANVILAGRDTAKGERAVEEIRKERSGAGIEFMPLDLADLESVRDFSDGFRQKYEHLDVLLNNAGIMMSPFMLTKDGFEHQMGTNHLGHFALTGLLMDHIKRTPYSRVVTISSNAHKYGKMDFSNLMFKGGRGYGSIKAYARSKLANLLFTYELHRRFEQTGINALAVAAHPGVADTELGRYIDRKVLVRLMKPLWNMMTQSAAMGALPGLRAAVDPEVRSAAYYGPDGSRGMKGYPVIVRSSEASYDRQDAEKLWDLSEKLTGVVYKF